MGVGGRGGGRGPLGNADFLIRSADGPDTGFPKGVIIGHPITTKLNRYCIQGYTVSCPPGG